MSSRLASMAVTCAAPSMPSRLTRSTISTGASRGFPPVRVTETNAGSSDRRASKARNSAASPSGVLGGKNSNEMRGRPRPKSSLICTRAALARRALLLQRLHALVLPIVVAGGHGHQKRLHPPVALAAQDAEPLVEFAEVLVRAGALVHRAVEGVAQASDREAERGQAQLVGEGVPLSQGERPQRFVARDERLEALQVVAFPVNAEPIHGGGEVEDELAAARRLEAERGNELVALPQEIVAEEIAVDDALRQPVLEVVLEVRDLIVERANDLAEVRWQSIAHLGIELRHAIVGEAVLDPLLVAL